MFPDPPSLPRNRWYTVACFFVQSWFATSIAHMATTIRCEAVFVNLDLYSSDFSSNSGSAAWAGSIDFPASNRRLPTI